MPKRKFPVKTEPVSTRVTEQVLSEIKRIVLTEGYNARSLIRKDFRERGITLKMEGGEANSSTTSL